MGKLVRSVPRGERDGNIPDLLGDNVPKVEVTSAVGLIKTPMGNENELMYKPRYISVAKVNETPC